MLNNTDLLCDLIRIKSVTDNIPEVNRCVNFLRGKLEAEGLHCAVETSTAAARRYGPRTSKANGPTS